MQAVSALDQSALKALLEAGGEPQAVLDRYGGVQVANSAWEGRFGLGPAPSRGLRFVQLSPDLILATCAPELVQVPGLVLTLDSQGTILFCNLILPGLTGEQVLGSSIYQWVEPDYHAVIDQGIRGVFELGETVHFEVPGPGPHGTRAWYTGSVGPVRRDGRVELANLVAVDSTASRQARDQLALYEQIYLHSNDAIAVVDLEGRYLMQNQAHAELLGYTDQELEGQTPAIHLGEESFGAIAAELAATGKCRTGAVSRAKDGTIRPLELSAFTVFDGEQKPVCYVGIKRDMSEHKAIEEELARARDAALHSARQKSEFLRNMSHEIRTPMNGVIAMTELLLDTPLTEEQLRLAETVHSSADSLLTILDDVLDFSKIEAGLLKFESIAFPPEAVVEAVLNLLRGQALARGLELSCHLSEEVPSTVVGDPGRLRQVLTNLVGNALKFTQQGSVRVRVTEPSTGLLEFEVADTGPGISQEDQAQLFHPFFQTQTGQRAGGTGLGLAISLQLVKLMGGEMRVRSELGQGATFTFTARFKQPQSLQTPGPDGQVQQPLPSGLRILVVEDNAMNAAVIDRQLRRLGLEPKLARDGREAVELAHNESFDIVLMDCEMPRMDGYEACAEVRRQCGRQLVIIAMTAHALEGDRERCLKAGMDDYMSKPVTTEQLHGMLERWSKDRQKNPT